MKKLAICLTIVHLLAVSHISWAAFLESPSDGGNLSGVGFISGWKCDATNITVTINDGEHLSVAMHQEREDLIGTCGSAPHGFIKQVNWAWPHISDGEHVIVAYDEGVEFDRAEFTVGTLGEEFPTGLKRQIKIDGFPSPNESTVLEWNESTQHFEVLPPGREPGNNYDYDYWGQFNVKDLHHIALEDELLYEEVPDVENCEAGSLSEYAKNRALEAVNQIRSLHGLPSLVYDPSYDNQLQEASLIMEANGFLTHHPPPSSKCYTEEGDRGAASNLSAGPVNRNPAAIVMSLVNDALNSGNRAGVGHRRNILRLFGVSMAFGKVGHYSALKTIGRYSMENLQINADFVAFPYGTYPSYLVMRNPPWSFTVFLDTDLVNNQGDFFRNASVTVKQASDGEELSVSNIYTRDSTGHGLSNFMSWQVEGWDYDTLYEVDIKNVILKDGSTRDYSYSTFIKKEHID